MSKANSCITQNMKLSICFLAWSADCDQLLVETIAHRPKVTCKIQTTLPAQTNAIIEEKFWAYPFSRRQLLMSITTASRFWQRTLTNLSPWPVPGFQLDSDKCCQRQQSHNHNHINGGPVASTIFPCNLRACVSACVHACVCERVCKKQPEKHVPGPMLPAASTGEVSSWWTKEIDRNFRTRW